MSQAQLTEQEAKFVSEYLVDYNPGKAALRAGYPSVDSGRVLMQQESILNGIISAQATRLQFVKMSAEGVIANLQQIVDRCMELTPVFDKDGNYEFETDIYGRVAMVCKFDPNNAIKALNLIGKELGMFVDRVDTNVGISDGPIDRVAVARKMSAALIEAARQMEKQKAH